MDLKQFITHPDLLDFKSPSPEQMCYIYTFLHIPL